MSAECTERDCRQPAAARVAFPQLPGPPLPGMGFVIVRPAATAVPTGVLVCLDHAHHAIDLMLLRGTPAPAPHPEPPTTGR